MPACTSLPEVTASVLSVMGGQSSGHPCLFISYIADEDVDARVRPRHDAGIRCRLPAEVAYHATCHQAIPDEQHHQRADRRRDESCALVRAVVADGLADESGEECARNAEHRG